MISLSKVHLIHSRLIFIFPDFEFRTIEKPDRPKREEHKVPVESVPIHEDPKLEDDYEDFHDHIDRLMEERLKDKKEDDKDDFEQNGIFSKFF